MISNPTTFFFKDKSCDLIILVFVGLSVRQKGQLVHCKIIFFSVEIWGRIRGVGRLKRAVQWEQWALATSSECLCVAEEEEEEEI